jgi:flagellar biosynthesis/type III secretory pathway protein FliH
MDIKKLYKQDGYQKGFDEGRRTGGKVKKTYINNLLNNETQNLSDVDSIEFKKGWEDGFVDGVRKLINKMVNKETILVKNLNEIEFD